MAFLSVCSKCSGTTFEIKENSPSGGNYKVVFVQCSSCGVPVGVTGYFDAGVLLKKQEKVLAALEQRLSALEYSVSSLVSAVQRR